MALRMSFCATSFDHTSTMWSCFAIELDPLYVDIAVRRWQAFTGQPATLLVDGLAFDAVGHSRKMEDADARP